MIQWKEDWEEGFNIFECSRPTFSRFDESLHRYVGLGDDSGSAPKESSEVTLEN